MKNEYNHEMASKRYCIEIHYTMCLNGMTWHLRITNIRTFHFITMRSHAITKVHVFQTYKVALRRLGRKA